MVESFENLPFTVTPAKAGVQKVLKRLDTGFRRYDDLRVSAEIQKSLVIIALIPDVHLLDDAAIAVSIMTETILFSCGCVHE